ncbi:calphotin-like [Schistocerca cancellata]|uniref:calphotin-like n=1 Tax=Schistocerca cancellata TaxID=274614 RepID=UPI002118BD25|nr:calphotin-like [Schistocerca cancellata]
MATGDRRKHRKSKCRKNDNSREHSATAQYYPPCRRENCESHLNAASCQGSGEAERPPHRQRQAGASYTGARPARATPRRRNPFGGRVGEDRYERGALCAARPFSALLTVCPLTEYGIRRAAAPAEPEAQPRASRASDRAARPAARLTAVGELPARLKALAQCGSRSPVGLDCPKRSRPVQLPRTDGQDEVTWAAVALGASPARAHRVSDPEVAADAVAMDVTPSVPVADSSPALPVISVPAPVEAPLPAPTAVDRIEPPIVSEPAPAAVTLSVSEPVPEAAPSVVTENVSAVATVVVESEERLAAPAEP